MKKNLYDLGPAILVFVLAVICLESLSRLEVIPVYLFPPPGEVFKSLIADFAEYRTGIIETLTASAIGLALASAVGLMIALIFTSSQWLERALYPYAIFFQTIPIISIAPLLVIWFGFGLRTVVISSFIVSVFPVIANSFAGLNSVERAQLDLFKLFEARKSQLLFKLRLPHAVPQILTGIKISTGLAMIGAIIGEFISGGGLGGIIDSARTQQRLEKVFAAILLASLLGLFLLFITEMATQLLLKKWRDRL